MADGYQVEPLRLPRQDAPCGPDGRTWRPLAATPAAALMAAPGAQMVAPAAPCHTLAALMAATRGPDGRTPVDPGRLASG